MTLFLPNPKARLREQVAEVLTRGLVMSPCPRPPPISGFPVPPPVAPPGPGV